MILDTISLYKGGIEGDHLKLALEPESASIWCQQVEADLQSVINRTGSKYMVADLGGMYTWACFSCCTLVLKHVPTS